MEPERRDKGDDQNALKRRKFRRHGGAEPKKKKRDQTEGLFPDQCEDEDGEEGEKAGDLPHRMHPALSGAIEVHDFDDKVGRHGHPGRKAEHRAKRHDRQHRLRPPPARQRPRLFQRHLGGRHQGLHQKPDILLWPPEAIAHTARQPCAAALSAKLQISARGLGVRRPPPAPSARLSRKPCDSVQFQPPAPSPSPDCQIS